MLKLFMLSGFLYLFCIDAHSQLGFKKIKSTEGAILVSGNHDTLTLYVGEANLDTLFNNTSGDTVFVRIERLLSFGENDEILKKTAIKKIVIAGSTDLFSYMSTYNFLALDYKLGYHIENSFKILIELRGKHLLLQLNFPNSVSLDDIISYILDNYFKAVSETLKKELKNNYDNLK